MLPKLYIILDGETEIRFVAVMDLWLYVGGFGPRYDIKPFETSAQALQRHFPNCRIYLDGLLVNSPGNREWIA